MDSKREQTLKNDAKSSNKRKTRPSQALYVPPAQRSVQCPDSSKQIDGDAPQKATRSDIKVKCAEDTCIPSTSNDVRLSDNSIGSKAAAVSLIITPNDYSVEAQMDSIAPQESGHSETVVPRLREILNHQQSLAENPSDNQNMDVSKIPQDNNQLHRFNLNETKLDDLSVSCERRTDFIPNACAKTTDVVPNINNALDNYTDSSEKKISAFQDDPVIPGTSTDTFFSCHNNCSSRVRSQNLGKDVNKGDITKVSASEYRGISDSVKTEDCTEKYELENKKSYDTQIDENIEQFKVTSLNENEKTSNTLTKVDDTVDKNLIIPLENINVADKKNDSDIDKEKEEMKRAIVNINRKSRPLIKHIDNDDMLRIDDNTINTKQRSHNIPSKKIENVSRQEEDYNLTNWEDLFDDSGHLQQEYLEEIVKQVGADVTIVKASQDYSVYQNKTLEDLEHVIELYDFPPTFKTQDIMQLYSNVHKDPMYLKWCDDTHALLVMSSPAQAQRALQLEQGIIKSRPLSQASRTSALVACKSDLKPAMRRPPTNMQTARRLINTHLGTRIALSKEEQELERQALRDAREQRRLERQNERDAWEGHLRSSS